MSNMNKQFVDLAGIAACVLKDKEIVLANKIQ
jgi:hypothetical protein